MWAELVDNRHHSLILGYAYPSKEVGRLPGLVLRADDDALLRAVSGVSVSLWAR